MREIELPRCQRHVFDAAAAEIGDAAEFLHQLRIAPQPVAERARHALDGPAGPEPQGTAVDQCPAALFGHWPGHDRVMERLHALQPRYGFDILDLSDAYPDNRLYYDHHHLNTDGVERAADTLRTVLDRHR